MGWFEDYHAAGGMQGLAARKLCEVLEAASEAHPLARVAALMRETAPPSLETWGQAVEVAGEIFSTADKPEPVANAAFEQLQERHPPHLLALAVILLADLEGKVDPPLPDTIRDPLWVHLNFLQGERLVEQVIAGNEAEVSTIDTDAARFVYMKAERRLTNRDAAKAPRPRTNATLRSEFIAAMTLARREGRTLEEFIESVKARSVGDLEIKDGPKGSGRYELNADAVSERMMSENTLKGWWKEAGRVS